MDPIDQLAKLLGDLEVVDLSPTLERGIPRWPTHPVAVVDPTITHEHDGYYCQTLCIGEHAGAHVDAPAHIIPSMMAHTIETYPAQALLGPAVTYDLASFQPEPGQRLTAAQVLELERRSGARAGAGDVVLLHFGWQRYWKTDDRWKWYGTNAPGLDEEAARLFAERKVRAVGSDTIACDTPIKDGVDQRSFGHLDHWLPNHIFIMENLHNLGTLPPRCFFMALPLKIRRGSGSPIRPVALVPRRAP